MSYNNSLNTAMSASRIGGTRTRLNRYASDSSDKSEAHHGSSNAVNGDSTISSNHNANNSSGNTNADNKGGHTYTSSFTSVGRSESFGREAKGLSMTDGGSYSSLASQRLHGSDSGTSGISSGTSGRYVPLSNRVSPPVINDSQLNSNKREAFFNTAGGADVRVSNGPSAKYEREKTGLSRDTSSHNHHGSTGTQKIPTSNHHHPTNGVAKQVVDGYVGFANLPNQVYRRAVKKGFEFTLMVVGESGMGKSTLINSLFLADIYCSEYPGPSQRIKKTLQVETSQCVLKENGVKLTLTIVDTPGFGDAVDNSNCWQPVIDSIEKRYDEYLNAESRVSRKTTSDHRIHCCLYFISPNGHGLKPLDVEFMKRLHDKVNIIPVIAKADTMTPEECRDFKKTILNEIQQHKIRIYEFPDTEDEEDKRIQKKLKERVPFAVVGSNTTIDVKGQKLRGRVYPWGVVEVENLEHNDFLALRNMLIRTHMQDLKDVTNNVHYENFRYNRLAAVTTNGKANTTITSATKNPLAQMDEEKKDHVIKMKKMEAEMEQVFEMKVKEKKQKLKDSEVELERRAEQMRRNLDQQQKELEEKRKQFEQEKKLWEESQRQLDEQRRSMENVKDTMNKKKKSLFN